MSNPNLFPETGPRPEQRNKPILRIMTLLFVIILTVVLFIFRDRVKDLEGFGYPGIFLASLLTNASLILPVPGVLITTAMGAVFHPIGVALAAGLGATLGELSGYLAGFSGQRVIEKVALYDRLENWMRKYGEITIMVMAFIPNPLFDVAGIMAGGLKMPVVRFMFFCALGKIMKMLLFAYGGFLLGNQLGGA